MAHRLLHKYFSLLPHGRTCDPVLSPRVEYLRKGKVHYRRHVQYLNMKHVLSPFNFDIHTYTYVYVVCPEHNSYFLIYDLISSVFQICL